MRILVTGGSGKVGRVLIPILRGGHDVRGLSRTPRGDGWAVGDLRRGSGVDQAVAGVHTVVHLATANGPKDVDLMRNLVAAIRRSGSNPHVIFLSIVGIDRIPMFYYRAKLAAERLLAGSGLQWTVQRATQFHDLIATIFSVQRASPAIFLPAGMRFQPIGIADVAQRLAELVEQPPQGMAPDIGGPEIHPATDLAREWLHATARRRLVVSLPLGGKTFRAFRAGENLAPEHAVGTQSFAEFLAAQGRR